MKIDWNGILADTEAEILYEYQAWCGNKPFAGCDILLLQFPCGRLVELQWDDDGFYVVTRYRDGWNSPSSSQHDTAVEAIEAVRSAAG